MNSYIFLKKTIISKISLFLWLTVLLEIYTVLHYQNSSITYNFSFIYANMLLLFKFSIIIIQYLFFISIYLSNYEKCCIILRYKNIKILKRLLIKDVIILTVFFVLMFNILAIVLVKMMFNSILILESLKYIILTIIFQLFSFMFLGYLFITFFLKSYRLTRTLLLVLILYFILILFFPKMLLYFILPPKIKTIEIINMFRVIISIYIISMIFFVYNKDKVVEAYGKKI